MMVCRYDDSRLLLTLQIDHSRIAGLFAAHWGNAEFDEPRPYTAMAIAAQEHDSGWWEWETRPTVNPDGSGESTVVGGDFSQNKADWGTHP